MIRILGLDIASRHTGLVVLNKYGKVLHASTVKTKTGDKYSDWTLKIMDVVANLIYDYKVTVGVIENYSFGATWNLASITMNAELTGMLKNILITNKCKIYLAAPNQLKKFASGKGNTKKNFIPMFVKDNFKKTFATDDECDAFILARIGLSLCNKHIKNKKYQQEVLDKINGIE